MLILLPVGMNYRTERLPIVTLSLIGVNTLIYLVSLCFMMGTDGDSDDWILENLWLIPAQSMPWMYLTSMFVHGGLMHLVGNMLFLFLFGCCVEDLVGRWKFLGFYLIGGLIAELVYIAMTPAHFASEIPMGGASGAISGCMGMYLLLRADADIEFKYFFWLFVIRAGEFEVPAWIAITCWFLKDLFWAVLGMTNEHLSGGVAFGAHVGGFLGGFAVIGLSKLFNRNPPTTDAEIPVTAPVMRPMMAAAQVRAAAPAGPGPGEVPTIYLHDGVEESGPFTLAQIQAALAAGSIGPEAVYWSDGMADWQSVHELGGPV